MSGGGVVCTDVLSLGLSRAFRVLDETRVKSGWYTSLFLSARSVPLESVCRLQARSTSERVSERFSVLVRNVPFRVAISTPWRVRSQHIDLLEMEAVKLAVRHMGRSTATRGGRVHLLVDNTGVLGSLGKGRSASRALNYLCRQVFAAATQHDISLELHWVPSTLNPADEPSRKHPRLNHALRCHGVACPP